MFQNVCHFVLDSDSMYIFMPYKYVAIIQTSPVSQETAARYIHIYFLLQIKISNVSNVIKRNFTKR